MTTVSAFHHPRIKGAEDPEWATLIPFPGKVSAARIGGRHLAGNSPEAIRFAVTPWQRFRGLKPLEGWRGVLVLTLCGDVHTCGMRYPIDIAFADGEGTILAAYRSVEPWKRRRCRGALLTLERWADEETPWFEEGMEIGICRREGEPE